MLNSCRLETNKYRRKIEQNYAPVPGDKAVEEEDREHVSAVKNNKTEQDLHERLTRGRFHATNLQQKLCPIRNQEFAREGDVARSV